MITLRRRLTTVEGWGETEERRFVLNATPGSAAPLPDKVGQEEDRAGKTGFEPATSGVTDQHSNQLSYFPLFNPLQSHLPFPFGNIQKGSTTVETKGSARSGAPRSISSLLALRD